MQKTRLSYLKPGDIFEAKSESGRSVVFLATDSGDSTIHSRSITMGFTVIFSKLAGTGKEAEMNICYSISSVEPLPIEMHNRMLHLDRKLRLAGTPSSNPLTEQDKEALLYLSGHYSSFPLW